MTLQLRDKDILYVEPNANYYSTMSRILLPDVDSKTKNNLNLDRAVNYALAIKKVQARVEEILDNSSNTGKKHIGNHYDIIFCEYELGDGKTAQDLLEKLRKEQLIPLGTIFIMIASERYRDKVMAVLEFAPDAYIIKGNTPADMEKRIMRAVRDRAELLELYAAIRDKEYEQALDFCDKYIAAKKYLTPHVMKLQGFILHELHEYEKAKKAYQRIIEIEKAEAKAENREAKPIPYAQNGLAKALYYLGEKEEAEEMLDNLVKDHPDFMEGYDLLSEIYSGTDRPKEAQEVLAKATKNSPHRFDRQKLLGLTALDNEDYEGAKEAFKRLTTDGKSSNHQHPENFAHLGEIHLKLAEKAEEEELIAHEEFRNMPRWGKTREEQDAVRKKQENLAQKKREQQENLAAASACVKRVKEEFKGSEFADAAKFCAATMEYGIHTQRGDETKAKLALGEAISLHKAGVDIGQMSERMQVNFACGCIEEGHEEIGASIIENTIQNSPRKEKVAKRAEKILKNNPEALEIVKNVEKKAESNLHDELTAAMQLSLAGKHDISKRRILSLLKESPNNPDILAKTVAIFLKSIDIVDPDVGLFNEAKKYLNTLIRIKSTHPDKENLLKESTMVESAIGLVNLRATALRDINNPDAIVPTIKAFFLHLNTKGFDARLLFEASELLGRLIKNSPNHPDILILQSQEERIKKKHGILPSDTSAAVPRSTPATPVQRNNPITEKPRQTPHVPAAPVQREALPDIDDDGLQDFIL